MASGLTATTVTAGLDEAAGFDATLKLLEADPPPTAVFVTNFNQMFGALAAIRQAGLTIPDDVSVVVCDNDPIVAYLSPAITAVSRPLEDLGAGAVDALLRQLQGDPHQDVVIAEPPTLVHRGSVAAPRS